MTRLRHNTTIYGTRYEFINRWKWFHAHLIKKDKIVFNLRKRKFSINRHYVRDFVLTKKKVRRLKSSSNTIWSLHSHHAFSSHIPKSYCTKPSRWINDGAKRIKLGNVKNILDKRLKYEKHIRDSGLTRT